MLEAIPNPFGRGVQGGAAPLAEGYSTTGGAPRKWLQVGRRGGGVPGQEVFQDGVVVGQHRALPA